MMPSIEKIDVDGIVITPRARPLDSNAVKTLMQSIEKIGLKTPITVRCDSSVDVPDLYLVSGRHRLEACKMLGMETIDAFVAEDVSEDQARLWEIAENLHRAELTALERSEHIAEWVRLSEVVSRQVGAKPEGGRPEGGVRAAARELNIPETTARRAVKIADMPQDAKQAAQDMGFADNQSVLEKASRSPDNFSFFKAEHERREREKANHSINRAVALSDAEQFAEWLMERLDLNELPTLVSWLEGTKAKDVIGALRRRVA